MIIYVKSFENCHSSLLLSSIESTYTVYKSVYSPATHASEACLSENNVSLRGIAISRFPWIITYTAFNSNRDNYIRQLT